MEKSFRELAARHGGEKWVAMYENMRDAMDARTGIKPNLSHASLPKGNKGTRLRRRVPASPDMPLMTFNLC